MRLAVAAILVLVAGCAGGERREVLVSAAASQTDAFRVLEEQFEREHPEVDVLLNFGGSSALREQILAGAPADVFAAANESNMQEVASAGLVVGDPVLFATNSMVIAVPAGNPGGVMSLDDLQREELLIGLCAPAVPCGDFAASALAKAGVEPAPDTLEPDVRSLLTKIGAGELDAGVVYVTDVAASPETEAVSIPVGINEVVRYPIAVLAGGSNPDDAALFVGFVLSAAGQRVLQSFGFGAP